MRNSMLRSSTGCCDDGLRDTRSARLSKRQIDPLRTEQRMLAVGERHHAVIGQPRRPTPCDDIAMDQPVAHGLVGPALAAEQKRGRQTQLDRNNRRVKIQFVLVLMQ